MINTHAMRRNDVGEPAQNSCNDDYREKVEQNFHEQPDFVSLDLNWRNKHRGMKNMPIFGAESKP